MDACADAREPGPVVVLGGKAPQAVDARVQRRGRRAAQAGPGQAREQRLAQPPLQRADQRQRPAARPPAPAAWQRQLPGGAPGLAMRAAKGPRQQLAQIAGAEQRRVQLEIDGQAAGVRPAAQALDQVDFPGRAVQVQALAVQPRNQLTQLPLAARSRKCGNAKVVFDVDAAVDGVTRRAPQAPLDTPGPWRDGQRLLPLPRQAQRGLVDLAHRAQIQQHTHVQRRVAPFQREPAALQRAECVLVHAPILVQAVLQHSPLL